MISLVVVDLVYIAVVGFLPCFFSWRVAVLECLLENVGRVVSKTKLLEKLYGWNEEIDSNTLENFTNLLLLSNLPL